MRGAPARHSTASAARAGPTLPHAARPRPPAGARLPPPSASTSGTPKSEAWGPGRGVGRNRSTAARAASVDAGPRAPAPTSLREAASVFAAHPSPRLIAAALAALTAARLAMAADGSAPLTLDDALAALAAAAGWVAAEPGLHAVLHFPGWPGAAVHASHHAQPYHHVSIDPPELVAAWMGAVGVLTAVAVGAFSAPAGPALTGLLFYCLAGCAYEAVHYASHCAFTPPWGWARALRAHHKRHHLHAESHWLAFTLPALDSLSGRAPARVSSVPRGPMAEAARSARREERRRAKGGGVVVD